MGKVTHYSCETSQDGTNDCSLILRGQTLDQDDLYGTSEDSEIRQSLPALGVPVFEAALATGPVDDGDVV